MSVDFSALLFYGMPVDGERGWELVEAFAKLNGPIEIANLDFYSAESNYMLYVSESWHSGDKRSEPILVRLAEVTGKEQEWRRLIVDACAEHGLAFVEPDWYFATAFS